MSETKNTFYTERLERLAFSLENLSGQFRDDTAFTLRARASHAMDAAAGFIEMGRILSEFADDIASRIDGNTGALSGTARLNFTDAMSDAFADLSGEFGQFAEKYMRGEAA